MAHYLWLLNHQDVLLFGLVEGIRVKVESSLPLCLVLFYRYAILVCISILANAGHLP